jgi:hypothetical protein
MTHSIRLLIERPHLLTSRRHRRAGEFRWQREHRRRSGSVAIFTVATTLTILALAILSIFVATNLPAGMFTLFKFKTVLAVTEFPTGIFVPLKFSTVLAANKFWTVLATTILTT